MIKIFTADEKGRIYFTKEELELVLNEAYYEGQKNSSIVVKNLPYTIDCNAMGGTTINASSDNPYTVKA